MTGTSSPLKLAFLGLCSCSSCSEFGLMVSLLPPSFGLSSSRICLPQTLTYSILPLRNIWCIPAKGSHHSATIILTQGHRDLPPHPAIFLISAAFCFDVIYLSCTWTDVWNFSPLWILHTMNRCLEIMLSIMNYSFNKIWSAQAIVWKKSQI